jgi:hypothetical protein
MKTYCLLKLHHFGQNKHAAVGADLSLQPVDGTEKPILFLSIEDADKFVAFLGSQRISTLPFAPAHIHPCRWQ